MLWYELPPARNTHTSPRTNRTAPMLLPPSIQDTEFPGVVARPIGTFKTSSDYHYQTMRCNVDLLKIIQIGLTLSDEDGNYPQDVSTWQFNFHFSIKCVFPFHFGFASRAENSAPPPPSLPSPSGVALCCT